MKRLFKGLVLSVFCAVSVFAQFGVEAELDGNVVRLTVSVPEKHYL